MILRLVRLIILRYNRYKSISRGARLLAVRVLHLQDIVLSKKLSNRQSGSVIFRPVRLTIL